VAFQFSVCFSFTSRLAPVTAIVIRNGVSFSPAGLLTPFHLGASSALQKLGWLTPECALAGASGGALAAVTSALEVSNCRNKSEGFNPLAASIFVAQECRDKGARLTLRTALDEVLDKTLPADVHEIISSRPSPCIVAYSEVSTSGLQARFISKFSSKSDVIDCLRASCNIPFYFNGNSLWVEARRALCIDGFFASDFNR
jgi:predicted acylesterase/phospholipase RssA